MSLQVERERYEEVVARLKLGLYKHKLRQEEASVVEPDTLSELGLLDWIPEMTQAYKQPRHLRQLVEAIERSEREMVRLVVSTPPRHGKSETLLHGISWRLKRDPTRTHGYVSYGSNLAHSKSRIARTLAKIAGVPMSREAAGVAEWRTTWGGGLLAAGIGSGWTGHGVNGILVVDDPIKKRSEAESSLNRDAIYQSFNSDIYTRLEPGASVIVCAARWHPEDLPGRLIKEGWPELRLPAINDDGEALWPERWTVEKLLSIKEQLGEYDWESLYQGRPRPRGASIFHDAHYYDELPTLGYRAGIGADLAYTAKTHADYSVAVTGRSVGPDIYIENVIRMQVEAPRFAAAMRQEQLRAGGVRVTMFVSATEKGAVQFMEQHDETHDGRLRIEAINATSDKFIRAQPAAALWNAGHILVPRRAPWLEAFLSEVCGFTGVNDSHDDQVDGLAGLVQAIGKIPGKVWVA